MNVREVRREAKKRFNGLCRVCRDCNGVVCATCAKSARKRSGGSEARQDDLHIGGIPCLRMKRQKRMINGGRYSSLIATTVP